MSAPQLSVIIVNYNVKHFIEQCLFSVLKASEHIACEIVVVDNNSVDGSVNLIKEKFPNVRLIENKVNTGFSVANNQAIKIATGKYVLLLNPDTIVQEDTFEKCLAFMDTTKDAGGLGIKMFDGKGKFLPESKRGLPTPAVAFYKIFGLASLFPKSKQFGQYHLTYLNENQNHDVAILSGAFMLMRKVALDKVGLLDETFFMYGEDIDLSYRITQGGYRNYYFSESSIIHYKGESTKKSSINYVVVFYKAMAIFAKKHYTKKGAGFFIFLIYFAIYFRAAVALTARFARKLFFPLIDFVLILTSLYLIKNTYETHVKLFPNFYSANIINFAFPIYTLVWMFFNYLSGGYDVPLKLFKIVRGVASGSAFILVLYSLLPEYYRFSRALILLGCVATLLIYVITRLIYHFIGIQKFKLSQQYNDKRIAIVGSETEFNRVNAIIEQTKINAQFIGFVNLQQTHALGVNYLGEFNQISEIIKVHRITEIIFCAKDMSSQQIINNMLTLVQSGVDFKIAPPESLSIIGSNDVDTAGDLYVIDINSITKSNNKRNKRLIDILISVMVLIFSPILFFIQEKKSNFFLNIFNVLFGFYTWVGYGKLIDKSLPKIKPSVLSPTNLLSATSDVSKNNVINLRYAKDYSVEKDLNIVWKCLKKLGI